MTISDIGHLAPCKEFPVPDRKEPAVSDSAVGDHGPVLSCAFATELATPDHIAVAEKLGYHRAWCYDSPALLADVWSILTLAAQRTSRIGLGPGVLIPSLRHPMVTAAAIATLDAIAPGRVAVGVGSGFTGRLALGQKPVPWTYVADYIAVLRALLRGETTTWDGAAVRMLHPGRTARARPIDVPILVGGDGPRGAAVARRLGDGIFSANPDFLAGVEFDGPRTLLMWGSVIGAGEASDSARMVQTLGPATAVLYHVTYERGGAAVDALPQGTAWRELVERSQASERHLAVHAGHQIELNDADAVLFPAAAPLISQAALVGSASRVREQVREWHRSGITEVTFQPSGPDIHGELERFAEAVRS
jgi:5,10-methylenetetrahydromethanopterin reductase